MSRRDEYDAIFEGIDEKDRSLIDKLIDETIYLEDRMDELKKMPFIHVHPNKPELQKSTPAAKQYKECSQSYMNAIRILAGILRKVDTSAEDDLLKKLEEFQK